MNSKHINSFLHWDENYIPNGKTIVVKESSQCDATFLLTHLLKIFLQQSNSEQIQNNIASFASFAENLFYFKSILVKQSFNLENELKSGRFQFFNGLSMFGAQYLENNQTLKSLFNNFQFFSPTNVLQDDIPQSSLQILPTFSLSNSNSLSDFLKILIPTSSSISIPRIIILHRFDLFLEYLWSKDYQMNQILSLFVLPLMKECKKQNICCVFNFIESKNPFFHSILKKIEHLAGISFEVRELDSGTSKDVTGKLLISKKLDEENNISKQERKPQNIVSFFPQNVELLYKIQNDQNVKIFTAGTVS